MRLAVFASGSGSNFQAILDAIEAGTLETEVALCLSNNAQAGALERANLREIPTVVHTQRTFPNEATYTADLLSILQRHSVDFIALAGYMKKVPLAVVQAFRGRMLNIHPALLPAFGGKGMFGKHVHRAVLEYGVRWSGATIHLVDEDYDTGPIVLQEVVPVEFNDTPETLAARILKVEHQLYPRALQLFAKDRVRIEGRKTIILPHPTIPS